MGGKVAVETYTQPRTYSQPRGVTGVSLLDITGFGGTTVLSSRRADGTIMVIAHPRASKRDWDRVWNRLPSIEVQEFDYHIRPDGTEVYLITPALMVTLKTCNGIGTIGCCCV